MTVWSLASSAAAVFSSPNTQLVLVRLALDNVVCSAVTSAAAWPYVLLVSESPVTAPPYNAPPAGWPSPILPVP